MQNFNLILDISSLIWDEADYNVNKDEYYNLVDSLTYFFEKLEHEKPRVLLSSKLQYEIFEKFPYGKPPYYGSDFEKQALSFLSKVETIEFNSTIITSLVSVPNLIKVYYSDITKNEVQLLVSKIHSDNEISNVYFTFEYLWDGDEQLRTELERDIKEYETIISDRKNQNGETQLDAFFEKIKLVFEHNPKHDKSIYKNKDAWEKAEDKEGFISQLSCYNGVDNERPQEVLDNRYPEKLGGRYISYDGEYYVVFRCHSEDKNLYHGFDEYNEDNPTKVPPKVKAYFNK